VKVGIHVFVSSIKNVDGAPLRTRTMRHFRNEM